MLGILASVLHMLETFVHTILRKRKIVLNLFYSLYRRCGSVAAVWRFFHVPEWRTLNVQRNRTTMTSTTMPRETRCGQQRSGWMSLSPTSTWPGISPWMWVNVLVITLTQPNLFESRQPMVNGKWLLWLILSWLIYLRVFCARHRTRL